jgi:uncharacterized protein YkwD
VTLGFTKISLRTSWLKPGAAVLGCTIFLAGCGRQLASESELQQTAASSGSLNLMIGELAAASDSAWHIQVGANVPVDSSSVRVCFGPAASCTDSTWTPAPAVQGQSNIFAPAAAFALTHGAMITMKAVGAAGEAVQRTVRIDSKTAVLTPDSNATPVPQVSPGPNVLGGSQPNTTPPQAPSDCWKADEFICQVEVAIVRMTNEYRARSGRAAVVNAPKIGFVSRKWSEAQANMGRIGHAGFPASRNRDYIAEFGSMGTARLSSENVAMFGGGSSQSAEAVARRFADMWWNSPGHRTNMLGSHRALGVGVYRRGSSWYATQIFGSP